MVLLPILNILSLLYESVQYVWEVDSKWTLSIDELTECFIRIVAVMVDIFRLSPERKLVDAPLTNKNHLNHRVIYVTVI